MSYDNEEQRQQWEAAWETLKTWAMEQIRTAFPDTTEPSIWHDLQCGYVLIKLDHYRTRWSNRFISATLQVRIECRETSPSYNHSFDVTQQDEKAFHSKILTKIKSLNETASQIKAAKQRQYEQDEVNRQQQKQEFPTVPVGVFLSRRPSGQYDFRYTASVLDRETVKRLIAVIEEIQTQERRAA